MVFEDILGECKKDTDEVSKCPRCGSTDVGTRSVAGKTIGFFCAECKYEWSVTRVSNV